MIFAFWDMYIEERTSKHFFDLNKKRNMPYSTTDDYRNSIIKSFEKYSEYEHFAYESKQAFTGLDFALYTAALE